MSAKDTDKDNFYSIIDMAKDLLISNDWWDINEKELVEYQERQKLISKNEIDDTKNNDQIDIKKNE